MRVSFSILTVIFLVIEINIACSGNPFESGYIITRNKDTIRGTVEIITSKSTPGEVLFRETGANSVTVYSPSALLEFGTAYDVYKSAAVKLNYRSYQFGDLRDSLYNDYLIDTVFLRLIVSGDKELLYYKDSISPEMFFIKNEFGYEWLIHSNITVKGRKKNQRLTNNNYIGQLILYLTGCSSMNLVLSNTSYDMESLVKAFQHYYNCINSSVELYKPKEYKHIELYAIAGVSFTKTGFGGNGYSYLTESNFPWSADFSGGVAVDVFLPEILGRWSINNEVIFTSFHSASTHSYNDNEQSSAVTHTDIGASYLKINNMLRSKIPLLDVSLFFNFGLSNGFTLSTTNKMKQVTTDSEDIHIYEGKAIPDFRNYNFGFIVGFGIKYKRFSAEARYEIGNGVTSTTGLSSNLNRFYIFMGYKILN